MLVCFNFHASWYTLHVGPDVESTVSSEAHSEGISVEPEDQQLYMLCLCEHQALSLGGSKKKKGIEIFVGFLVSLTDMHCR